MALKSSALPKKNNDSKFPPQPDIDAGTYPARVVQIIDLGLQPQRAFKGEDKVPANDIMITYEFVDTFMVDEEGNDIEDKPRWFSEILPWFGTHVERAKSSLRYKALDPNDAYEGDLAQCINTPCNVTVVINKKADKTYVNIASVTGMRQRDADKCPELVNPSKVFDLSEPDMEVFEALPQWIQDKIKNNLEYAGSPLESILSGDKDKPRKEVKKAAKRVEIVEDEDEDANPY